MGRMDRLLHLDRTLDELDPPRWPAAPPDATHLVRTVHALRRVRLGELGVAGLRTLVAQRVGLAYVLPLAVNVLAEEPLVDAYFYPGDLLLTVVGVPGSAWGMLPDVAGRLRDVVAALPDAAVAELPGGGAELARFVREPPRPREEPGAGR